MNEKNFYLFPMKQDEKTGFRAKKWFLVAILKFSEETRSRFFEPLDFTIHYIEPENLPLDFW